MRAVGLTVNGIPVIETVEPRMHLADLLRERLGLTGTHLRCEQGACGACTLLIDGQPARSCITYAVLCEGAQITTIEGLEDDPVMAALRQAFTAEHGLQCGFCTPGMLITARDIVSRLPAADERRIRLELSGNLCRCTGYVGIVRAIRRVLDERRAGALAASAAEPRRLGPVGSRHGGPPGVGVSVSTAAPTPAGPLLGAVMVARVKKALARLLGKFRRLIQASAFRYRSMRGLQPGMASFHPVVRAIDIDPLASHRTLRVHVRTT